MSQAITDEELWTRYASVFEGRIHSKAAPPLISEMFATFDVGSDPTTLPAAERAQHAERVAAIEAARAKVPTMPTVDEEFRSLFASSATRLNIKGSSQEAAGANRLTEADRQFFAAFGVLPNVPIPSLTSEFRGRLEKILDRCHAIEGLASSYIWPFDQSLLELALNEEIVDKVSSLLGENITLVSTNGPFYFPPGTTPTPWHHATARDFGGDDTVAHLDLVSVWVPVHDVPFEKGPMKMIPGSFRFANAFLQMMRRHDLTPKVGEMETLEFFERSAATGFGSIDWISKVISRRLNMPYIEELQYQGAYDAFNVGVDKTSVIPQTCFDLIRGDCVSLPARAGEAHFFTSQNYHAAHANMTQTTRKAMALRYVVTTNKVFNNTADVVDPLEKTYRTVCERPGGADYCKKIGFSVDRFRMAAPRICVRGSIPDAVKDFYIDKDLVRDEIQKHGSWLV